jgi:hypothetical protein
MRTLGNIFATLLVAALVCAAYVGYRTHFGSPRGGPCTTSSDCAELFEVQCVQIGEGPRYCTRPCRTDDDCGAGSHCAGARELSSAATDQRVCIEDRHTRDRTAPTHRTSPGSSAANRR